MIFLWEVFVFFLSFLVVVVVAWARVFSCLTITKSYICKWLERKTRLILTTSSVSLIPLWELVGHLWRISCFDFEYFYNLIAGSILIYSKLVSHIWSIQRLGKSRINSPTTLTCFCCSVGRSQWACLHWGGPKKLSLNYQNFFNWDEVPNWLSKFCFLTYNPSRASYCDMVFEFWNLDD